jgi:hypothetical protein
LEEERNVCKPMYHPICQTCPYMMQGMYMNPGMMYQQQMQQPMMGQMGYPMGRDDNNIDEGNYRDGSHHHHGSHHYWHHGYYPYGYYPYMYGSFGSRPFGSKSFGSRPCYGGWGSRSYQ